MALGQKVFSALLSYVVNSPLNLVWPSVNSMFQKVGDCELTPDLGNIKYLTQ